MRPPMNQSVVYHQPVLDSNGNPVKDRYGRVQTTRIETKARVQRKSRIIKNEQGVERRVSLEIDLPGDTLPQEGLEVEFLEPSGIWGKGTIESKEETLNLAGTKVFFRTVFVSG